MFKELRTYSNVFSFILLSGYLFSCFSIPLLEGVHFLLHLNDETTHHSFQTHQKDHQHQLLTHLNELNKIPSDVPLSSQKDAFKNIKIFEFVNTTGKEAIFQSFINRTKPNYHLTLRSQFYKHLVSPPPKQV